MREPPQNLAEGAGEIAVRGPRPNVFPLPLISQHPIPVFLPSPSSPIRRSLRIIHPSPPPASPLPPPKPSHPRSHNPLHQWRDTLRRLLLEPQDRTQHELHCLVLSVPFIR